MIRRLLLALAAAGMIGAAPSPVQTIGLPELGYRHDVTVNGVYPTFTFSIPRYPQVQSASLKLTLHVSPVAADSSTIQILVNRVPVYVRTLKQIGHDPKLVVPIPIPTAGTTMQVAVSGYLRITGDICADLQTQSLFLTVGEDSALLVREGASEPSVSGFFHSYGDRVNVMTDGSPAAAAAAIAVPYRVRQLEAWHQPVIALAGALQAGARTISVRASGDDLARVGNELRVTPAGLDALTPQTEGALAGTSLANVALPAASPTPAPQRKSLADLGYDTQTLTGLGDQAYEIPFYADDLGGFPTGAHLHISLAHTPLLGITTGMLQVQVNGTLVGARELAKSGTTEDLDVPLDPGTLGAANDIRIIASSYTGPGSCQGSLPAITTSLLGSSYFSWTGIDTSVDSIADFLKLAGGNVAVLVGDPSYDRAAFNLMGELGRINHGIQHLHVGTIAAGIPVGTAYAIVLGKPDDLATLDLPVRSDAKGFRIVNPATASDAFSAVQHGDFATIQTGRSGAVPVLAIGASSAALGPVERLHIDDLAEQTGNIAFDVDGRLTSYRIGDKLRVVYAGDDLGATIWRYARLPLALVLIALIILGSLWTARRLSNGPVKP